MVTLIGNRGQKMVINHCDNTIVMLASMSKNGKYEGKGIHKEIILPIVKN
jgi:hypothetical protein